MVGIGMANATATSSYLSSQLVSSRNNDTNMKKVLKECADKYGFAGDALQASVKDLASESYDYASMHINAAADYPMLATMPSKGTQLWLILQNLQEERRV
ncbi:cell wall / vacuolar inhibitor of fructosidase 2 [Prunus dulcis]|uniref:Cell wall / vacuolar inhibitor of fructosidase 2 n=1 Tax=Prunus dulcis TaxID=3755 RepID=A0A4Y1RPB0_PRUDU|nr:cell wall / vacuolar inhibitor of fructosidase 2 [Prunus dulcis]